MQSSMMTTAHFCSYSYTPTPTLLLLLSYSHFVSLGLKPFAASHGMRHIGWLSHSLLLSYFPALLLSYFP